MKKAIFLGAIAVAGCTTDSARLQADELSPRAKYILAFDFVSGEARDPYPRRAALEVPDGLDGTPRIIRSVYFSGDPEHFISEEVRAYRPSWNVWPYQVSDIFNKEVDVLESRECLGNDFFWPMSGNTDASNEILGSIEDYVDFEHSEMLSELMYEGLTNQFLDFIGADDALRQSVLAKDYLFSTEEGDDLNVVLYEAWKAGRLSRPTVMIPPGECSPGWAEYFVTISFKPGTERLFAISSGDHRLCTLANVDPWDSTQCRGGPWEIVREDDEPIGMFGSYFFKTRSSEGQETIVGPIKINSNRSINL